jgi:hypothetical protein
MLWTEISVHDNTLIFLKMMHAYDGSSPRAYYNGGMRFRRALEGAVEINRHCSGLCANFSKFLLTAATHATPSDGAPALNFDGYNFRLHKLNRFKRNFVTVEMV